LQRRPDRGEDLPSFRGLGQRAVLGQRAGSGGVGAGRGDAEPGHGEDLPPADNLVDLSQTTPNGHEECRIFDCLPAQHRRRRDKIIERLQQDRLRRQQEEYILFEPEIAMMEVQEEILFLLNNPASFCEKTME
jgi:hypothetical protein